jgi:hypothetical protein
MFKIFNILLLAALSLANLQHDPLEDIADCVVVSVPKLVQDTSKAYTDFENQDFISLFSDLQTLTADTQAFITCLAVETKKALQVQANEAALKDSLECINHYGPELISGAEKFMLDYKNQDFIAVYQDLLVLINDTNALVDCLNSKEAVLEALEKIRMAIRHRDSLSCLMQYVTALADDTKNVIFDYQNGDLNLLMIHAQTLIMDARAFMECLEVKK